MEATTENVISKQWEEIREFAQLSAAEYWEQNANMDASDYAHEQADGAGNVIYNHEAWKSCLACRESDQQIWYEANDSLMDTCGNEMRDGDTMDSVVVRLAYWVHYHALLSEIESTKPDTDEEE